MQLAGLVLMGGKNTRFDGKNKAFLVFNGKFFLDHVLDSMEMLKTIYLSVADKEAYSDSGYPIVEDIYKDIGPIGGIHAGLFKCKEDALLVIACDMPYMTPVVVSQLIDTWEHDQMPAVIQEPDGQLCSTAAIYTKACLPFLEKMIHEHHYKVVDLFKLIPYKPVPLPQTPDAINALKNINSEEDYKRL